MQTLMANTDLDLETQYLLDHVWRDDPEAMQDTVWLYISYLKRKLEAIDSKVSIAGGMGGSFRLIRQDQE